MREALLNSIVHRDYSFSGSNLINIYDDRIEFVSLGGLVAGLELKSIFLGVSQSLQSESGRRILSDATDRELWYRDWKDPRAYRGCEAHPEFETAKGVFRVTLPNRNEVPRKATQTAEETQKADILEEQKNRILAYARKNGSITRKEAENLIGSGTTKAFRLLKQLCAAGKLRQKGSGRLSTYETR